MVNSIGVRNLLDISGIQEILNLDGLEEIAINQPHIILFDRGNGWEKKESAILDYNFCKKLGVALAVLNNDRFDETNPCISIKLPDGERGQIIMPPASEAGCISFTIRKPSLKRFSIEDYANSGRFDKLKFTLNKNNNLSDVQKKLIELKESNNFVDFFKLAVKSKQNILLVGGTGSGKTTIMKALVDLYDNDKRLITIEDVHELTLPNHSNHVHLFYKIGGLTPKKIIESCMRMKPDHVLLAELRGDEAWSYLEMLNTGHKGSITTIHANDCTSAFSRLAALIKQSEVGQTLEYEFIMRTIKSSIDIVCFCDKTYPVELYYDPIETNKNLGV